MPYQQVTPDQIHVLPLAQRRSKSRITTIAIDPESTPVAAPAIEATADLAARKILAARQQGA